MFLRKGNLQSSSLNGLKQACSLSKVSTNNYGQQCTFVSVIRTTPQTNGLSLQSICNNRTKFTTNTTTNHFLRHKSFIKVTTMGSSISNINNNSAGWGKRLFHSSNRVNADEKDYYGILGVDRGASKGDIKKAYHKAAIKYHPDKNAGDKEAEKKFADVNNAYEVLKDDQKRQMYDQFGSAAFEGNAAGGGPGGPGGPDSPFGGFDMNNINEIMEMMGMGGMGGGGGRGMRDRVGADVEVPLRISFKEAVSGCTHEVSYRSLASCKTCTGKGSVSGDTTTCSACGGAGVETINTGFLPMRSTCRRCGGEGSIIKDPCRNCGGSGAVREKKKVDVKIPAGVDDGMNVRVVGAGDAGERGGNSGNLYIKLSVKSDNAFTRDGTNVHVDVPLSVSQAILGGTINVATLDGSVRIKVPGGTQPGEKRVLRGRGIKEVGRENKGNQYLHFRVVIPANITDSQKKNIEDYAKEEKEAPESLLSKLKSFWNKNI